MGGLVAAVGCSQADRDEGFDGLAGQLGVLVAEHFLEPPVDVRDVASVVAKGDRVGEDVGQLRQHGRGDGRGLRPVRWAGCLWRGGRCRRPGGDRRFQGGVDGDQAVEPVDAEHPLDDRGGDYQPQVRAADEGALVGAHHCLRAGVITRQGRGQVRD